MGNNKYMKKIELMKLKFTEQQQEQTHFGVITRARALALQRAQAAKDTSSYLQLRSRRLQKPPPAKRDARFKRNNNKKRRKEGNAENDEKNSGGGFVSAAGVEASCGENFLESEAKERNSRETTPCSLIRNPDAIRTPGSTTKHTASADAARTQNSSLIMPTSQQMNEFFADTENEDQRRFIEKYNFDVINDKPLPGRYEWEKLDLRTRICFLRTPKRQLKR